MKTLKLSKKYVKPFVGRRPCNTELTTKGNETNINRSWQIVAAAMAVAILATAAAGVVATAGTGHRS